ncbi:MAG: hypothetical protein M1819_000376 [Sarea resinae]|nr:MAG: hypothetical protein M1819_000376 [Sarea resinae]
MEDGSSLSAVVAEKETDQTKSQAEAQAQAQARIDVKRAPPNTTSSSSSSTEAQTTPPAKEGLPLGHNHSRSLSGGVLSKRSSLRNTSSEPDEPAAKGVDSNNGTTIHPTNGHVPVPAPASPERHSAMRTAVQQQTKTRKRKGSLRKTALLGTGILRLESSRERRGSSSLLEPVKQQSADTQRENDDSGGGGGAAAIRGAIPSGFSSNSRDQATRLAMPTTKTTTITTSSSRPAKPDFPRLQTLSHAHNSRTQTQHATISPTTSSPTTSPTLVSPSTTTTTTSDDEPPSPVPKNPTSSLLSPSTSPPSYFPPSPLSQPNTPLNNTNNTTNDATPLPPWDWDYTSTASWGWVLLTTTWLVFVIGMGSCFDVWSWAWDVGQTPYAPPELEDDPTLPIVGYYPALIILTAVMAWVWVVVAWVGMKYFKHAKISGEDV